MYTVNVHEAQWIFLNHMYGSLSVTIHAPTIYDQAHCMVVVVSW